MKRMLIVLTGVMVLSGLVLATTYSQLSPRIEENRIAALNASLAALFSGADLTFETLASNDPTIYRGVTASGDLYGYAVRLQTQGYGGTITMLVGLSPDLEQITGIEVVEQLETPGLGGRITEPKFQEQFAGLKTSEPISYVKNVKPDPSANEIQAISGATITSRAVVGGINNALGDAIEIIKRQDQ